MSLANRRTHTEVFDITCPNFDEARTAQRNNEFHLLVLLFWFLFCLFFVIPGGKKNELKRKKKSADAGLDPSPKEPSAATGAGMGAVWDLRRKHEGDVIIIIFKNKNY